MGPLVDQACGKIETLEGFGFEKLVGLLYEERSRKGLGDFSLTSRVQGFWDRSDTEIDLVALDEVNQIIRFATCKRSEDKVVRDIVKFSGHIDRFQKTFTIYKDWKVERVCIAPELSQSSRATILERGYLAQDFGDLCKNL